MLSKFFNRIRNFIKDQGGMEALQTVCLIAIAAMILIGAVSMGNQGTSWMKKNFKGLQDGSDQAQVDGGADLSEVGDSDDFDEGFEEFPEDTDEDIQDLADELE